MTDPIYKLSIFDSSGNCYQILGPKSALVEAYVEYRDGYQEGKFSVVGFCDDAAHSPMEITLERDIVKGMSLEGKG